MDVVINIEPDQEDEMCPRNQQKPQKKRRCPIWFWLCLIIVPVVIIGSGVTAYYLYPKGADPTPQPSTTSPETPSSTTPPPPEEKTIPPITSTTTAIPEITTTTAAPETTTIGVSTKKPPSIGAYLRDVPMPIDNEDVRLSVSLYFGQVSHDIMLSVCNSKESGVLRPAYFNNREEETSFDKVIHANSATVFGNALPYNETRLLWTGCHYEHKNKVWNTKCGQDPEVYNNFCNQPGWKDDLEHLKASTRNEAIYIVKDYGKDKKNACWKLYDSEQLKLIMGIVKRDPSILPFTCIWSRIKRINH